MKTTDTRSCRIGRVDGTPNSRGKFTVEVQGPGPLTCIKRELRDMTTKPPISPSSTSTHSHTTTHTPKYKHSTRLNMASPPPDDLSDCVTCFPPAFTGTSTGAGWIPADGAPTYTLDDAYCLPHLKQWLSDRTARYGWGFINSATSFRDIQSKSVDLVNRLSPSSEGYVYQKDYANVMAGGSAATVRARA